MRGIYIIINNFNGHSYIGLSNNVERRFIEHKCSAKRKNNVLYRAFRKYGVRNFEFIFLETVCDDEDINKREAYWIDLIKPEYNMNAGGLGNSRPLSEETKKKISKTLKKNWSELDERKKQKIITQQLVGRKKGYKHTEETKKKLALANIGKKQSPETIRKRFVNMSEKMTGNKNGSKRVLKYTLDNVFVKEYENIKTAAQELNIHPSCITKALKGVQQKAGNFKWKYKNEQ